MSTRISFSRPQGQPVHFNSNLPPQGALSSTPYNPTYPESSNFYHTNNPPPLSYTQPNTVHQSTAHPDASLFYRSGSSGSPPQRDTVAIERERVQVRQIQRPQFEKIYNRNPPHKKLGPQEDPPQKSACHPCWLALIAIIGLAGIALALLFGLGIIGNSSSRSPSASISIARPQAASPSSTANSATSSTNTSTSSASSSSSTGIVPTGVTSVSSAGSTSTSTSTTGSSSNAVQPASISPIQVAPTTASSTSGTAV